MAADAFDKFKSSINRGIATISVKTSSSLEKSKLKTRIETLRSDIEKKYSAAGESVYKIWSQGSNDVSQLSELFETIRQKHEEIEKLTVELAGIDERDSRMLEGDGALGDRPHENYCPSCGEKYEQSVKFCRKCGTKLQ